MSNILILGIGNVLQRDDGVGVRVIERLKKTDLPLDAEILNWVSSILDLPDLLAGREKVIIVDAVQGGGQPGSIYRFVPNGVEVEHHSITSLHQIGLVETLELAQKLGCYPRDVVIFGVEPKAMDWGPDLSPEVEAAVPEVVRLVMLEVGSVEAR